jgi:hypothetical protein
MKAHVSSGSPVRQDAKYTSVIDENGEDQYVQT